jgi:hypothetical protein
MFLKPRNSGTALLETCIGKGYPHFNIDRLLSGLSCSQSEDMWLDRQPRIEAFHIYTVNFFQAVLFCLRQCAKTVLIVTERTTDILKCTVRISWTDGWILLSLRQQKLNSLVLKNCLHSKKTKKKKNFIPYLRGEFEASGRLSVYLNIEDFCVHSTNWDPPMIAGNTWI